MANTLGIPERTLAQVADPANTINVIGGTNGRRTALQPLVVRITDHIDNVAAEVGDDTERMAIFMSLAHGHPWKKYAGSGNRRIHSGSGTPSNRSTDIFPNFTYSTFE